MSDYTEGWHEVTVEDGQIVAVDSWGLPAAEFEERAQAVLELSVTMGAPDSEEGGWLECGLGVAATAAACAAAQPWLCIGGSIATACSCLPKLIEEFEDLECP